MRKCYAIAWIPTLRQDTLRLTLEHQASINTHPLVPDNIFQTRKLHDLNLEIEREGGDNIIVHHDAFRPDLRSWPVGFVSIVLKPLNQSFYGKPVQSMSL